MPLLAPILSAFDPDTEGEGSLDPLGLGSTYELLAERIYPDLTVRMIRPRFMTAIAAGARVCQEAEDVTPADGITPPFIALEWIVVHAFARSRGERDADERGIPGIQKATRARENGRSLSAAAYLTTPKIFGYTGVYKRIAVGLRIIADDISLDEGGCELVRVWEREQQLPGFYDGQSGLGLEFRTGLIDAVRATLRKGAVAVPDSWKWWPEVIRVFAPSAAGPQEKAWLRERLMDADLSRGRRDAEAFLVRRELFERMIRGRIAVTRSSEAEFVSAAKQSGSSDLARRIGAIQAFERLGRPLTDAFDMLRARAANSTDGTVILPELRGDERMRDLTRRVTDAVSALQDGFRDQVLPPALATLATRFVGAAKPELLLELLLEHHDEVQRGKPPDGKRPWLERVKGDTVFVRAPYRASDLPEEPLPFVHDYRSGTAGRFLTDLAGLQA